MALEPSQPVCYRHPDRPTRLSCSECDRPMCPECSYDAAVGQKCPECNRPEQRTRVIPAVALAHVDRATTPVAYALIAINLAVFLVGLVGPGLGDRILEAGAQRPLRVAGGEWWRLVTAMFLHGGIAHILFNMYALWLFGPVLERRFGSLSFASLYLAAGIAGGAAYQLLGGNQWAVGASGAIFGLFGALLAASYRQRHTRAGAAVFGQLMLLLAINLALPLFMPSIAWEAHAGGLVAGMLIAAVWDRIPREGKAAPLRRAAVALVVAGAALAAALFS